MKRFISSLLILSIMGASLLFSACGDSGNTSAGEAAKKNESAEPAVSREHLDPKPATEEVEVSIDSTKPKITDVLLSELNSKLASNQVIPEFTSKSEAIPAHQIGKNMKVAIIPGNYTNSYDQLLCEQFVAAAKSAGIKETTVAETDGTISTINDALADAVKEKCDAIVLAGDINKDIISGAIETAQSNGIEVYSAGSKGVGESDHFTDYTIPIDYQYIGELMADWGIVKTNGKIHAVVVNCIDSELSPTISKGFKEEFEKYVSSSEGSCTTINVKSIEISNGLSDKIKKAIQNNSKINYIFVFDNSAVNDAINATIVGNDVKVVATGGSVEDYDNAQNGRIEMLVAQSYEWNAYAIVDYVLRGQGGKTLPARQDTPVRILTKEIIKKATEEYKGHFDSFHKVCFGSNFEYGYSAIWN